MSKRKKIILMTVIIASAVGLYIIDRTSKDYDDRIRMDNFIKAASQYAYERSNIR